MSEPPNSAMRAKRSVASRRQCGMAPASTTGPGSPPQRSRIIAVAASTASGIRARSMPRSKRCRASETIWWRRPVCATRTGSNRAHSTNTAVVAASQPVGSPPITPAIDCTPAASAMAQSSGSSDVVLAVQGVERFAGAAAQGQHVAGQFADVEHVQRAAEVEGEEVRHVDQRVDRAQADGGQPVLQPLRAGTVVQVADGAAEDPGAGLGPVDAPARAAVERRGDAGRDATVSACRCRRRPGRARCRGRQNSRRGWA